eukprot:TRINITY_DN10478_c0_g2_i1.p1 TRINITY_DN10478_c0_g2~~TRINITY_DN10478_c0_g2_i1.p1  ORF type:complete len:170 (-),score=16.84 TRINITY_DN10478_c0_g2_i1:60-569(-)
MLSLSKRIRLWVTRTILEQSNVHILSYFLDCIKELMQLDNWECIYQMYLGFSHPEIQALFKTHSEEFDPARMKALTDVTTLFQVENPPFGRYKRVCHNFGPPMLLILASDLEDLEFINNSQPDYQENGFINLEKCRLEAREIESIIGRQGCLKSFDMVPHIRAWLQDHM